MKPNEQALEKQESSIFADPIDSNFENSNDLRKKKRARIKKSTTVPEVEFENNLEQALATNPTPGQEE